MFLPRWFEPAQENKAVGVQNMPLVPVEHRDQVRWYSGPGLQEAPTALADVNALASFIGDVRSP